MEDGYAMRCKVKTFMWRACSEALPTKKNLQKRKILDNPECSQCSKGEENTIHALRECETIHCVWDQSFGGVRSDFPRAASFSDLVSLISTQPRKLELFAVVAWPIWFRRNKLQCNEQSLPTRKAVEAASALLSEFQNRATARPKPQKPLRTTWNPSAREVEKVNYDGAMFEESLEAGLGVVDQR